MDWINKQILIISPQTDVAIQDLIDFIRTQEALFSGIIYPQVAGASGKETLGGTVSVGITLELLNDWQLKFWEGNYIATISGGNLVGGLAGDPVAYTPGVQVVIIQSAASTLVVTGSGVTEQDKLDIAEQVWNEEMADHLVDGTTGKSLSTASAGGVDLDALADAVWEEAIGDHAGLGSAGAELQAKTEASDIPAISDIVDAVWARVLIGAITYEDAILAITRLTGNKVTKSGDVITIYEEDESSIWRQYNLADGGRVEVV